ncbi:MAG: hypothetical protein K1060chlam5_00724 [Candidatus Anoxychlamydiales bacterium]|nr:hypothetical protein [Candidatus Anoxychlamydiales bacterium]
MKFYEIFKKIKIDKLKLFKEKNNIFEKKLTKEYSIEIKDYYKIFPIDKNKIKYDEFVLLTIPKTGTHLLCKCLELITGRYGLGWGVLPKDYNPYESYKDDIPHIKTKALYNDYITNFEVLTFPTLHVLNKNYYISNFYQKKIITLRDPRDQIISLVFHKMRENGDNLNQIDKDKIKNKIKEVIRLTSQYKMDQMYKELLILKERGYCLIKFEDLIGPMGGGYLTKQKEAISKIANYINYPLNEKQINFISEFLHGANHPNFRVGRINQWKDYFDQEINELLYEYLGNVVINNGYEESYSQ